MRAIDADKLIEKLKAIEGKEFTAIFINQIIKLIEQQPSLQTEPWCSEIVITAKAWDELPADFKARMITHLKSQMTITGYVQS